MTQDFASGVRRVMTSWRRIRNRLNNREALKGNRVEINGRTTLRLKVVYLVVLAMLAFSTGIHAATAWPDRPIRFVVHVAAGGGVDLMARILADRLSQQLPQRVLVENMGGGGGSIAARSVAKAEPDAYHSSAQVMPRCPPSTNLPRTIRFLILPRSR